MANLASSDVAYTFQNKTIGESGERTVRTKLIFGDGVKTYPSGGVPLTLAGLGLPNVVKSLIITDAASANGYLYKWDSVNNKLRIYQGDNTNVASAPAIELVAATATPASATLYVECKGY